MAKVKKKLSLAQKRAKAEQQVKHQWIFMNGKQVRIKKPPTVYGIPVNQFIEENADSIWLHQNEMWELIPVEKAPFDCDELPEFSLADDELPF
jgi:hypothetical protein